MARLKLPYRKETKGSTIVEFYETRQEADDRADELEAKNPRHLPAVFKARNHHWMTDDDIFFGVHYNLTRGIR